MRDDAAGQPRTRSGPDGSELPSGALATIARALEEDIGTGDVTTNSVVPADAVMRGRVIAKQRGVVAGLDVARAAFRLFDPRVALTAHVAEGARVGDGEILATVSGPARALLTVERVALNFLGRMSGVATLTRQLVDAVAGTPRDHPRHPQDGARPARARQTGGAPRRRAEPPDGALRRDSDQGQPHRRGRVAGRGGAPRPRGGDRLPIEVEARTLDDVRAALALQVTHILLDNMSGRDDARGGAPGGRPRRAGGLRQRHARDRVRAIAETGVDLHLRGRADALGQGVRRQPEVDGPRPVDLGDRAHPRGHRPTTCRGANRAGPCARRPPASAWRCPMVVTMARETSADAMYAEMKARLERVVPDVELRQKAGPRVRDQPAQARAERGDPRTQLHGAGPVPFDSRLHRRFAGAEPHRRPRPRRTSSSSAACSSWRRRRRSSTRRRRSCCRPRRAGCSLAASITAADVRALKQRFPGVPVVTYVNTYADVKAESDICCTSSNAAAVVESLGVDTVIFLPDEYLAKNVARETGKHVIFPTHPQPAGGARRRRLPADRLARPVRGARAVPGGATFARSGSSSPTSSCSPIPSAARRSWRPPTSPAARPR